MREHPDHHDAELLLRLYDLRREEKLRRARDWFAREFQANNMEELRQVCPRGSEHHDFFRMVVTYWDMAASIVNNGLINEEFFFENTSEFFLVWERVKSLTAAMREIQKNPLDWSNLEKLAGKFEKWMTQRAPEGLEVFRQRIRAMTAKS